MCMNTDECVADFTSGEASARTGLLCHVPAMSEHKAMITWSLGDAEFTYDTYSRAHTWTYENGLEVAASAAPQFLGDADRVDPEAAFVAALASCHMLTFLAIAARKRIVVTDYRDSAVGHLQKNEEGRLAVTRVVLQPRVTFRDEEPSAETLDKMHALAHRNCFIANSVLTKIELDLG